MRISDWSSDVCSSDLRTVEPRREGRSHVPHGDRGGSRGSAPRDAGRAEQVSDEHGGARQVHEPLQRPRARTRTAERRVGKECVSTCRTRRSQDREKKKNNTNTVTNSNISSKTP